MNERLRKALWYVSNGKVPPVWNLIPSKYDPDEAQGSTLKPIDHSVRPPSYVDSNADVRYTELTCDTRSQSTYFSTVSGAGDELHLELTPEYRVDGCYFHILNANNYAEVIVSATGTVTGSAEQVTRETSFRSGEQMKLGSLPVSMSFDSPVERLSIDVVGRDNRAEGALRGDSTLAVSTPSVRKSHSDRTPIFLISIDTFRHDHLDVFDELNSLLNDIVVPEEPRTQGRYTRPSHASTLTGVHPGTHGYCTGFGRQIQEGIPITPISPDLQLLPEFLTEHGYTCGACTSWSSVTPNYGFGRGFQEFRTERRDWDHYKRDCDTVVNRALEWTERMIESDRTDIFYFMHIFDAHLPYLGFETLSEQQDIDVNITDGFKREYVNGQPLNYDELMAYSEGVTVPQYMDDLQQYYVNSLERVSRSLERFVQTLDHYGILDDSLILIAGDHGEEFLEDGVAGHATLRDTNIRPGMLIKPPRDQEFFVPAEADLIDVFPTISDYVSGKVPDQCAGESWLRMDPDATSARTRITEAFTGDSTYAIAVEVDGTKGVFAFEADIPSRPTPSQVDAGIKYEEVVALERDGKGTTKSEDLNEEKTELLNTAIDFLRTQEQSGSYERGEKIELSSDAVERLENLGYK